ncbi:MAG: hypothetical protein AAGC66_05675 [Leifsonia sp.]
MAGDTNDENRTPAQDEFVLELEGGPLTDVVIVEVEDGEHVDVAVNAVTVDPDTGETVPVSIALTPDDSAFVISVADDDFVVPLEETSEEPSHRHAALIRPLRRLQQLAQRVEEEVKGKAKELAKKFSRK